jgi:hypothetical protein
MVKLGQLTGLFCHGSSSRRCSIEIRLENNGTVCWAPPPPSPAVRKKDPEWSTYSNSLTQRALAISVRQEADHIGM